MKRELAVAGVALLVSILLSSPTIAEPNRSAAKAKADPAPIAWVLRR